MVDSISDMLIRIKNAQAVSHKTVDVPFSKIIFNLAKVLEKEGLIEAMTTRGRKIKKIIEIKLKYEKDQPIIEEIKRVSKPGQRIYLKKSQVKSVRQGYGLSIISTSQGLMTNKEAKKKGLGGEILCEIW